MYFVRYMQVKIFLRSFKYSTDKPAGFFGFRLLLVLWQVAIVGTTNVTFLKRALLFPGDLTKVGLPSAMTFQPATDFPILHLLIRDQARRKTVRTMPAVRTKSWSRPVSSFFVPCAKLQHQPNLRTKFYPVDTYKSELNPLGL